MLSVTPRERFDRVEVICASLTTKALSFGLESILEASGRTPRDEGVLPKGRHDNAIHSNERIIADRHTGQDDGMQSNADVSAEEDRSVDQVLPVVHCLGSKNDRSIGRRIV